MKKEASQNGRGSKLKELRLKRGTPECKGLKTQTPPRKKRGTQNTKDSKLKDLMKKETAQKHKGLTFSPKQWLRFKRK
jgi:hypothetical protein